MAIGELSSLVKGEMKPRTVAARRKQMIEALSQTDRENLSHGKEIEKRLEEERISAEEGEKKRSGEEPVNGSGFSFMEETMLREQVMQDQAHPDMAKTEEVKEQSDTANDDELMSPLALEYNDKEDAQQGTQPFK